MSFESSVRTSLPTALRAHQTVVVIDAIRQVPGCDPLVLLVTFHLEGQWASTASFSFPFSAQLPLEESLTAFRESIAQSWMTAHQSPPTVERFAAGSGSGD